MERTYNVFADNGLFVLGYYLDKVGITGITEKDIVDNIDMMSDKIKKFVDCKHYSNIKSMCFPNSVLTQPSSKETLEERLKSISRIEGEEYCSCCGEYRANIRNESLHRSYIPNAPANTFYNFSNNLQGVNVCSRCIILTIYSILNARVNGLVTLYSSESDRFMIEITAKLQEEIMDVENIKVKEKSNNVQSFIEVCDRLVTKANTFENNIDQYLFINAGQGQQIQVNTICNKYIKLIRKLYNESLWDEFKKFSLVYDIVYNKLEKIYINKLIDESNRSIKCSKNLLYLLNKEVNRLDTKIKNIIKDVVKKLKERRFNERVLYENLKNIKGFIQFQDYIAKICDLYHKETGESLLDIDSFDKLCSYEYKSIINLMKVGLLSGSE